MPFIRAFCTKQRAVSAQVCLMGWVVCLFLGCSHHQEDNSIHHSGFLDSHTLVSLGDLSFQSSDSVFIGRVGSVASWRNQILISDFYRKWVCVFDSSLQLLHTVGREGKGPGEFTYFPYILANGDSVWFIDVGNQRATCYDHELKLVDTRTLPSEYSFRANPVLVGQRIVFPGSLGGILHTYESFEGSHPLVSVDSAFGDPEEFGTWSNEYFSHDPSIFTYTRHNIKVLLAPRWGGGFFALQTGAYLISAYDKELNYTGQFGLRPSSYKDPPAIEYERTSLTMEAISRYMGRTTTFHRIAADTCQRYLLVNYINYDEDLYKHRTLLAGEHFLQIYDEHLDCIFDGPIPGILMTVLNGKIYVLIEECPEYIKCRMFALIKRTDAEN